MVPSFKKHSESPEYCILTIRGTHTRYDETYGLKYSMKSTDEMGGLMDYVCLWLDAHPKFSVFFYGKHIVHRGDTPKKLKLKRKAKLNVLVAPKTIGQNGRIPRLRLLVSTIHTYILYSRN